MSFNVVDNSKALKAYSDWANSTQLDTVAGQKSGAQVSDLSKATSGFARLFNTGAVSRAREAALHGFQQALTEALGRRIADMVWLGIGGGFAEGKGLTAEMVKTGLNLTNRLIDEMKAKLLPGQEWKIDDLLSLSNEDLHSLHSIDSVTSDIVEDSSRVMLLSAKADAILCMSPASQAEASGLKSRMNMMLAQLEDAAVAVSERNPTNIKQTQMRDMLIGMINEKMSAVKARSKFLENMERSLADGKATLNGLAKHWQDSLKTACEGLRDLVIEGSSDYTEIKRVKNALNGLIEKYADDKMLAKVCHDKKKLCSRLQKELTSCVKKALGPNLKKMESLSMGLGKALENAHLDLLNKGGWETIDKTFGGFVGGKKVDLTSTITCGRKISEELIGSDYENLVQSYNCHSKTTKNAVNLATSELKVDGKTVFRGVRHGVHDAKCVLKRERAGANVQRAEQTVKAAFVEYLKMHPDVKGNSNGIIHLPMTSISLQTPAVTGGEKKKVFAQKAAWDAINTNGPMEIFLEGKIYKVKPVVTQLFYGVNMLAIGMKGEASTGWGNVSGLNRAGLQDLLSRADAFARTCGNKKTAEAVRTLSKQIEDMAAHKKERSEGTEPYKMPARLAVLSYLMGNVPVWNCKSGKDRTGMLDVEAKFLATLIDQGQRIPEPNEKLSDEQTQLLRSILMESGNLEMQGYNTGVEGYKLNHVDSIYKRMHAGKVEEKVIKGGSSYVGS